MHKICIIDYGVGNLNSIKTTLKDIGYNSLITRNKSHIKKSDLIIIPGVGKYDNAMKQFKKYDLYNLLKKIYKTKHIFGICLGMQILSTIGYEDKYTKGLNFLPGKVIKSKNYNIGWDKIFTYKSFNNFNKNFFYFNHNYYFDTNKKYILAYYKIGKHQIPAIIKKGNIFGIQFHPEKSQINGKRFLKFYLQEIIKWPKKD